MKVRIEHSIEKAKDGKRYRGFIEIAFIRFNYKINLSVPVQLLGKALQACPNSPAEAFAEARSIFKLTFKKGRAKISLTDTEYSFFMLILLPSVMYFYFDEMYTNLITVGATYDLQPEAFKLLRAEKFGCKLSE